MSILNSIIHRKTFVSMLFTGLTMLGYISYKNLSVELYPNAELPILIVQIGSTTEVDPKYMENQGVIPLEGVVSTLEGIEEISSTADRQRGIIYIYLSQDVDFKYSYLKLQEKVDAIESSLPDEFTVQVVKVDTEQLSNQFMSLQVRGSGGVDRVRNTVDTDISTELSNVDGIANVEVFGGREKSLEIILNEDICKAKGITLSQVQSILEQNARDRVYVGQALQNNKHYFVNLTSEYTNIKDIENLVIDVDANVYLKDIAEVFFGVKEEDSYSRVNGKEAVTIRLIRDQQVNLIDLSHRVIDEINALDKKLASKDVEIVIQSNTAETMETNIDMIINLALSGGVLAIFILWIFLRNLQLVSIIALAIPISIFTAFNFFYAFDISINSLTLVGMALAVGMLLDNSVVVMENIYRLTASGVSIDKAVVQGTKEVWRAILAATLTTITVFLPFIYSTNFMVELLGKHVGISIISTLLVSLVVALMLVPMIAHFFLSRKNKTRKLNLQEVTSGNRLMQIYIVFLKACMRRPAQTIIGALVIFFVVVFLSLAVSVSSLQEVETSEIELYITMSTGATLENTDKVVREIEKRLENIEEKEDIVSKVYEEEATVTVSLLEDYEKISDRAYAEIKADIKGKVSDISNAEIEFEESSSQSGMGGGGNPGASFEKFMGIGTESESVLIKGNDFDKMRNIADDISYYLEEELTTIDDVNTDVSDDRPEVHILFDQFIMTQYGITLESVTSELNSFQSEYSSGVQFKEGTEEYDIIIKTNESDEEDDDDDERTMEELKEVEIEGSSGSTYELQNISKIIYSSGMSAINRYNQEKQIEVTYRFLDEINESNELLDAARLEIDEIISGLTIPSGVAVEVVHEDTSQYDDFYFLIGAAFILIYMILASVFESLATPVVLLFSIPLATVGSFLALILTNNSLVSANTLTGFLILLGVVVNNGIILIDYTRILRRNGYSHSRALMMAGMARVRPILITAITTIVAMIPLAMGDAEYVSTIGAPFAITVIGGLSLSTVFTLLFIPTLNSGLESALAWLRDLNWKIKVAHTVLFIVCCWFIYFRVDSFVWQLADLLLVGILIPGLTYFIMTSLRQANTTVINRNEEIQIKLQSLVKVYERDNKFVREWKSGKKLNQRRGIKNNYTCFNDFEQLIWQVPLFIFIIYFIYIYQDDEIWTFILSHSVFFFLLYVWKPIGLFLSHLSETRQKVKFNKINAIGYNILFWGVPFINLVVFYFKWENIGAVISIGIIWYLALIIYTTSNRLHNENVKISQISGRFGRLRRTVFNFVMTIPLIGKKKTPFKALKSVSLKFDSGMIGLLGPNGAGKTTMMRIVCGILDESYGKIWFNKIDTSKKREELQGLIGYLPQAFGMYENMTAYEFLNYQAILKGLNNKEYRKKMVNEVLVAVHMENKQNDKIGSFSGGMKQRIGIAQTLLHLPRILVVDEPTAGLDPRERIRFRNLLVELSRDRIVIFSTHIIEDIASSCNRVAVLNKGELKYMGAPNDMAKIADNYVWQFAVTPKEFDEMSDKMVIIHHMRDGDKIRIRSLSEEKPHPEAVNVKASLEDSYLWLLRKK